MQQLSLGGVRSSATLQYVETLNLHVCIWLCHQVAHSHAALLVCGLFNVTIFAGDLEAGGYQYDEITGLWQLLKAEDTPAAKPEDSSTPQQQHSNSKPQVLQIGSPLSFTVKQLQHASALLALTGQLSKAATAAVINQQPPTAVTAADAVKAEPIEAPGAADTASNGHTAETAEAATEQSAAKPAKKKRRKTTST